MFSGSMVRTPWRHFQYNPYVRAEHILFTFWSQFAPWWVLNVYGGHITLIILYVPYNASSQHIGSQFDDMVGPWATHNLYHIERIFWSHHGHIGCSHSLFYHNASTVGPLLTLNSHPISPPCGLTRPMRGIILLTYTMVHFNVFRWAHGNLILY
jgi:hypothetical protein